MEHFGRSYVSGRGASAYGITEEPGIGMNGVHFRIYACFVGDRIKPLHQVPNQL